MIVGHGDRYGRDGRKHTGSEMLYGEDGDGVPRLGLVLGGGGGRGSYQIGVWKALHERGIDEHIDLLSGVSVGALNGLMFIQGECEAAEEAWLNISPSQVLGLHGLDLTTRPTFSELPAVVRSAFRGPMRRSVFSSQGLEQTVSRYVHLDRVSASARPAFAACCCIWPPTGQAEYFRLNGRPSDAILRILLASCAIPLIFERVNIEGRVYCDGGVVDNLPVRPAINEGCDVVIAVHLEPPARKRRFSKRAKVIHIIPSESLGRVLDGILDFTPENVRWRIDTGYQDATDRIDDIERALSSV